MSEVTQECPSASGEARIPTMAVNETKKSGGRTILFATWTPGYGGSEKHLLDLISRFEDRGDRLIILCTKSDPYSERLNGLGGRVGVQNQPELKTARDWFRAFREIKPDVLVLVYGWLDAFPWFVPVVARLAGIGQVYGIQHLIPDALPPKVKVETPRDAISWLAGKRARYLLGVQIAAFCCGKTICVSNAVRQSLVKNYGFPSNRTMTVHNGVSLTQFVPGENGKTSVRAELGIRGDEIVLVCTARLSWEKGIDILLRAISRLLELDLPCKCLVVGEGYLRDELLEQARTLGLLQNVFFVGFQKDVRPYLRAADAFILTSYKEGLPFSVLEAMAFGLPCILTDVGGNAEAVADHVNGLIIKPGSVEEVVQAVTYVLTHPQEREQMSRESRSRVCQQFDIEVQMEQIKRVVLA
jgi:glycosyltransferase involved in cell wall biosynthesis